MPKTEFFVNYELLGMHIRDARKARNLTQELMAEHLSVSPSHVGKIERGERHINLERLAEISLLLNVPMEDLIAECVQGEKEALPVINATMPESINAIQTLLKGQPQQIIDLVTAITDEVVKILC